jgi:hypothetical protein
VIDRLRGIRVADALVIVSAALMVTGIAVTADALVDAAQATPGTDDMPWADRLLLGLWSFRIEHTLWFTVGVLLLWHTVLREQAVRAEFVDVARLAGGVAIGYMLLAAAVVLGSTLVAATGAVGAGNAEVTFDGRERLLTWLLQVATAGTAGTIWALAAATVGEPGRVRIRAEDEDMPFGEPLPERAEPQHRDADAVGDLAEPLPLPPPLPFRPEPVAAPPAEPVQPGPVTAYGSARRLFEERLAFSPRRDDAKRLLDQIARAEREGRSDEASRLADRLAEM